MKSHFPNEHFIETDTHMEIWSVGNTGYTPEFPKGGKNMTEHCYSCTAPLNDPNLQGNVDISCKGYSDEYLLQMVL